MFVQEYMIFSYNSINKITTIIICVSSSFRKTERGSFNIENLPLYNTCVKLELYKIVQMYIIAFFFAFFSLR